MASLVPLSLLCIASILSQHVTAKSPNGLGITPQMGWDDWNSANCDGLSQELILNTAHKIVDFGLRDLGYQYVIMDDCWSDGRYDNGTLKPNMTRFPQGIEGVSSKVHDLGLKWGMYSSAGIYTCAEYQGSLGHEKEDAESFASWGVDYLKYDNCFNQGQEGTSKLSFDRYKAMGDALNATGRPIFYSLCNWGRDQVWQWASTISNSWRVTGDIYDSFDRADPRCPCQTWDCLLPGFYCSVMNILNKVAPIVDRSRPGGWNDLDALEVGNGGMSDDEYMLHFTMWAITKSPLIMGNDITLMDANTLSILSNPAIIAVNQDPLGSSAYRVWDRPATYLHNASDSAALYTPSELYFWTGMLEGGDMVCAFVNGASTPQSMSADMMDIFNQQITTGSSKPRPMLMETWDVYDLWGNRMDNATANAIIAGNATSVMMDGEGGMGNATETMRYNATAVSYEEGLKKNATALMGKHVGVLSPGGTLDAEVPGHGVKAFRLRSQGGGGMRKRDEL